MKKPNRDYMHPIGRNLFNATLIMQVWILAVIIMVPSAAGDSIRGSQSNVSHTALEYHQEGLQNDPLNLYVMQGDRVLQGKTYDLSGTSGATYYFAHWNNWKVENQNCNPDQINDIWYIRTGINRKAVYLDPEKWGTGKWYYWDAWECNRSYYDFSLHQIVYANRPIESDNKLAFIVIKPRQKNIVPDLPDLSPAPVGGYLSAYTVEQTLTARGKN